MFSAINDKQLRCLNISVLNDMYHKAEVLYIATLIEKNYTHALDIIRVAKKMRMAAAQKYGSINKGHEKAYKILRDECIRLELYIKKSKPNIVYPQYTTTAYQLVNSATAEYGLHVTKKIVATHVWKKCIGIH